jgi:hypothetical protein
MILLDSDGDGPTLTQVETINQLCTINPGWGETFYFDTEFAMAG